MAAAVSAAVSATVMSNICTLKALTPEESAERRLAEGPNVECGYIHPPGEIISGGASGYVCLTASGDCIIKIPFEGSTELCSRRDLALEASVYKLLPLGHPRFVQLLDWDPDTCYLTLPLMVNGNLAMYLKRHNNSISTQQRLSWVKEAAESLCVLHGLNVLHCDFEPKNFLLDENLGLRLIDFGGCSLNGAQPTSIPGPAFTHPTLDWEKPALPQHDIFGFGSIAFNIMTGKQPWDRLPRDEVVKQIKAFKFPSTSELGAVGDLIEKCWHDKFQSAPEILADILNQNWQSLA